MKARQQAMQATENQLTEKEKDEDEEKGDKEEQEKLDIEQKDDADIYFRPEKGNVIFASAIDGWAFR